MAHGQRRLSDVADVAEVADRPCIGHSAACDGIGARDTCVGWVSSTSRVIDRLQGKTCCTTTVCSPDRIRGTFALLVACIAEYRDVRAAALSFVKARGWELYLNDQEKRRADTYFPGWEKGRS